MDTYKPRSLYVSPETVDLAKTHYRNAAIEALRALERIETDLNIKSLAAMSRLDLEHFISEESKAQ